MNAIHPQYIKDSVGNNLVVILQKEFDAIMEELEDLDDIRAYDNFKKNDTGERVSMTDALMSIEAKRKEK
jgi:hypothetical protein